MENILYLDDYINFYNKKKKSLIIEKPYKNTLENGKIINNDKFLKGIKKILDKNKIHPGLINEELTIICTSLFNKVDKNNLKNIMENLNYKKINFISELDLLKVNKNKLVINCNYSYYYFYYTDEIGNISINLYKNDNLNKSILKNLVKSTNKKEVILYGKNYKEIKNILEDNKIDYYFYEGSENVLINILLKKM